MSQTIIFKTYNPENVEKSRLLSETLDKMGSVSITRKPRAINDMVIWYMLQSLSKNMTLEVHFYFEDQQQFEAASEVASTWDAVHHISRYLDVQGQYLDIADDGSIDVGNLLSNIAPCADY